ncbi:hypothetical protein SAMN05518856_11989 [Paenibacillus sp. OK003]|nr:hypothetical protein SAMN05518856_11989 [Paenibacillus sp. OK003]
MGPESVWIKGIEITSTLKNNKKNHILTCEYYAIDEAFQISRIQHYLPNPHDNIAYFIEDLSDRISGAELNDSDREVLAPDMEDIVDPAAYDIQILEEEQWG